MDATPEGKNAWTDSAKYQFLLRIIAQLKHGKSIKWDLINMPGRTTKSLQNTWTKINKEIQELENGAGDAAAAAASASASAGGTPAKGSVKKSGGRGRGRPKKSQEVVAPGEDEDDEEEGTSPIPCKLPKKRGLADDVASELKRMKTEEKNEFARALKQEMRENEGVDMFAAEC